MSDKIIKVALLDMYNGERNQGMRCIIDVVNRFNPVVSFEIFDVRVKCELPDISKFDIYISTGGPGNPLIGDGNWDTKYYEFIDPLFEGLADPFYGIDSRDYQVVQPKLSVFAKHGAKIISLEKIRDHVQYERAIMAVRFTDYFVGTQFHPEADPISFVAHLRNKEAKDKIKNMKGKKKFRNMLEDLMDDDKIYKTNETLIPNFLRTAINDVMKTKKMLSN